jgi:hypothetical protein
MEQRPLRLGDTLDDYCPRERRVTNHSVVAMIEEDVKQTRCTTCDAEHAYKGAKVPRRRKKETPAALFKEVLAGITDSDATPILTVPVIAAAVEPPSEPVEQPVKASPEPASERAPDAEAIVASAEEPGAEERAASEPAEDWPVHRPLIRAQLPRIEGQKEERRPTDFTIRQPGGRGHFRGGDTRQKFRPHGGGAGNGAGNGNRAHGGQRFAGGRPAGPGRGPAGRGGPSAGFRGGPPRQGGGGKKRSR